MRKSTLFGSKNFWIFFNLWWAILCGRLLWTAPNIMKRFDLVNNFLFQRCAWCSRFKAILLPTNATGACRFDWKITELCTTGKVTVTEFQTSFQNVSFSDCGSLQLNVLHKRPRLFTGCFHEHFCCCHCSFFFGYL